MCFQFKIPVQDFFSGSVEYFAVNDIDRAISEKFFAWKSNRGKRNDYEEIEQELKRFINELPPPSFLEVQKRTNVSCGVLKKKFPELCSVILKNFKEYRNHRSLLLTEKNKKLIRDTMHRMYREGTYPSAYRLQDEFQNSILMIKDENAAVWRETLKELGYLQ